MLPNADDGLHVQADVEDRLRRSTNLRWGIRDTFLSYLVRVPGSDVVVGSGASYVGESNEFDFPARIGEGPEDLGPTFSGFVRFHAHGGMLSLSIAAPCIRRMGGILVLSVADDVHAASPPARDIALLTSPRWCSESASWTFRCRLTAVGVAEFGDVYPPGQEMAPVRLLTHRARLLPSTKGTDT